VISVRSFVVRMVMVQVLLFIGVERSFLEREAAAVVVGHSRRWKVECG
jgi:hypothetical protein